MVLLLLPERDDDLIPDAVRRSKTPHLDIRVRRVGSRLLSLPSNLSPHEIDSEPRRVHKISSRRLSRKRRLRRRHRRRAECHELEEGGEDGVMCWRRIYSNVRRYYRGLLMSTGKWINNFGTSYLLKGWTKHITIRIHEIWDWLNLVGMQIAMLIYLVPAGTMESISCKCCPILRFMQKFNGQSHTFVMLTFLHML